MFISKYHRKKIKWQLSQGGNLRERRTTTYVPLYETIEKEPKSGQKRYNHKMNSHLIWKCVGNIFPKHHKKINTYI